MSLEVQVSFPGDVQRGKQVSYEAHEHGHILSHDLWNVEVSQSSHENLVLGSVGVCSFKGASHN